MAKVEEAPVEPTVEPKSDDKQNSVATGGVEAGKKYKLPDGTTVEHY
jgi:hypothetical protein